LSRLDPPHWSRRQSCKQTSNVADVAIQLESPGYMTDLGVRIFQNDLQLVETA
jgi:hypothetical protein